MSLLIEELAMADGNGGTISAGERLSRIEKLLEEFIKTSRDEIREARHLARNALHGIALQNVLNENFRRDIDRINHRYDEEIGPVLNTLTSHAAATDAESVFKKWLWPVLISIVSIAIAILSTVNN